MGELSRFSLSGFAQMVVHSDRSVTGKWVFIVMFEGINIGGSEGAKQVMFCGGQNIFLKVIS